MRTRSRARDGRLAGEDAQGGPHLQGEFGGVRTGRASSALVEKLKVELLRRGDALQQLAGFGVPEPVLTISPYDKPRSRPSRRRSRERPRRQPVERRTYPPGVPGAHRERRKELVKVVRHKAEEARVAVRNLRRQARHELEVLEKDGELGKDDLDRAEKGSRSRPTTLSPRSTSPEAQGGGAAAGVARWRAGCNSG